jgi:hypothetical protein
MRVSKIRGRDDDVVELSEHDQRRDYLDHDDPGTEPLGRDQEPGQHRHQPTGEQSLDESGPKIVVDAVLGEGDHFRRRRVGHDVAA